MTQRLPRRDLQTVPNLTLQLSCRCFINAGCQLIAGMPYIKDALHSGYQLAGLHSNPSVKALWQKSLACAVHNVATHITTDTHSVGDLSGFTAVCVNHPDLAVKWDPAQARSRFGYCLYKALSVTVTACFPLPKWQWHFSLFCRDVVVQEDLEEFLRKLIDVVQTEAKQLLRGAFPGEETVEVRHKQSQMLLSQLASHNTRFCLQNPAPMT